MNVREIKFRAWEKNLKEIIPVHNIDFEKKMINTESAWRCFDEIELMQYTGLRVNGEQPLFEGDIVPVKVSIHKGWKEGWLHFNRNAAVEYVESEMRFMFTANIAGFGKQYIPFDKSIRQSYKITGNIFDNPELLEVQDEQGD
jgi:uncharacterized phage protein (TIGR01671 family)